MTTYNIGDLADAAALTGAELVEVLQGGVNKKITASLLQGVPGRGVPAGGAFGALMHSDGFGNGVWMGAAGQTGQVLVGVTGAAPAWSNAPVLSGTLTVDLGSGALPAALSSGALRIAPSSGGPRIEGIAFAGPGLIFSGRTSGGTRSASTATPADMPFFQMTAFGHDGTNWLATRSGAFLISAGSLWSGTNRETVFVFYGTPNGSTSESEWVRLQNGNLGIGVAPTVGNGLLQFAAGTTKANGVAFGTDTFLYRSGANLLQTNSPFVIDYGASVYGLSLKSTNGGPGTKYLRVESNRLECVNAAFSAILLALDDSGNLGLSLTPTAGNGLLQLASGTTKANGIAFGTDAFIYRSAANRLTTDGGMTVAGTADGSLVLAGKATLKAAVPASFADLAAVRTWLASVFT